MTHVARNADSHVRRAEAAARGERVEQYAGGYAGRAAAIEAGAGRSAAELLDDVRTSHDRMVAAWASLPDPAWDVVSHDVGGTPRALRDLPLRRWQEVEVHLVDLDVSLANQDGEVKVAGDASASLPAR